ncbi:hypothetical protein EV182_006774 [Spiromyces aspiralis]|uniref:Uncharacterized protein n=1 Tax=Spiromyces aspiralis TaxID=68401 RepID=A0ACC1HLT1_9FUNG|nr:hypothetical protein EV182_006774 [Spiromyces aspiralis]
MDLTSYKQLRLHDRSPPTDLSDESSSSPSLSNFICDNPRYRPGFAGSRASPLSTSSENGSSIASDVLLPLITSSQSPPPSILSRVSVTDTATSTSLACRNDSDGSPARSAHPRNISTASDYHTTPAIELDNPRIRRNQQHSPGGSALASSSRPAGSVSPLHYQASPPRAPRPWFNPHVVDFGPMPVLQLLRMSSHKITTSSSVTVDANANSRAASRDEHHNTSWWLSIKGRVDAFFDDNILVG